MCRFTMYLGPPIRLDSLLIEPAHSLILQSFHASEREEPLNGDGFGVGWYAPDIGPTPAVFRSITPAWNNTNLRGLAGVVSSPCVLAHVRAASAGMPVAEGNCHPFQHGSILFMHNGHVGSFRGIRRALLAGLSDEAFGIVQGTTDSEHVFGIFMDELEGANTEEEHVLATCLNRAVWRTVELVKDHGGNHPSYLNLAVSDGHRAAACRFTDAQDHAPESLYVIEKGLYEPLAKGSPGRRREESSRSFVVSSERLTDDPKWRSIERNHLVTVNRDGESSVFRMDPAGLSKL